MPQTPGASTWLWDVVEKRSFTPCPSVVHLGDVRVALIISRRPSKGNSLLMAPSRPTSRQSSSEFDIDDNIKGQPPPGVFYEDENSFMGSRR